jgi:DeoR/GlpR family transcriptional regulator of sugar metabolism
VASCMIPAERRRHIVSALRAQRAVRVAELSDELGVSLMTIRRDLAALERQGVAARSYGGAVLRRTAANEPRPECAAPRAAEKVRLAQAAAALIRPHDTVFLGSGTTVALVARYVDASLKARVITHNLWAAATAQDRRLDVVVLGGCCLPHLGAAVGSWPLKMIAHFRGDKTFLGADGLDPGAGLTTPDRAAAEIELAMIQRTRGQVVVLAASSRVGMVGEVVVCPLERIDVLLTDEGLDADVCARIRRAGPRCQVV